MRTYERRISKDGKWEGEISRLHTFSRWRRYRVTLTQRAKRRTHVEETFTDTLAAARDVVREWVAPSPSAGADR